MDTHSPLSTFDLGTFPLHRYKFENYVNLEKRHRINLIPRYEKKLIYLGTHTALHFHIFRFRFRRIFRIDQNLTTLSYGQ